MTANFSVAVDRQHLHCRPWNLASSKSFNRFFQGEFGGVGIGPGLFLRVGGIAISPTNRVYVVDSLEQMVQEFGQPKQKPNPATAPVITGAVFSGLKLKINGKLFSGSPRVLVDAVDVSPSISSASGTGITLAGTSVQLNIKSGTNTVQVINSDGTVSNSFLFHF